MHRVKAIFFAALSTAIIGCGGSGNDDNSLNSVASAAAIDINGKSFRPVGKVSLADGSDVPVAVRRYVLTNGNEGNTIRARVPNVATYTLENSVVTITSDEVAGTRSTVFSGNMRIDSSVVTATGLYSQLLVENYIRTESGQIAYTGFDLNSRLDVRDASGPIGAVLTLDSVYNEPVVDFLSRNDLADLVGTTEQVIAAGTADLTITVTADGESETQRNSERVDGVVVSYTVQEFLDEFEVQGRVYQNVLVVDVLADQLNVETNRLEPTTSTYYLAQGLGIIRADNLNNFYGASLSWQLTEVNF